MTISASGRDLARGAAAAAAMFVALGTVAALWNNPLFMRMTPTGGFEIALLLSQSVLAGIYEALGGAALLAAAVWLKLTRADCFKAA